MCLTALASLVLGGLAVPSARAASAQHSPGKPTPERAMEGWTPSSHWVVNTDGTVTRTLYPDLTFHASPDGEWTAVDPAVAPTATTAKSIPWDAAEAADAIRPVRFGRHADRLLEIGLDRGAVTLSSTALAATVAQVTAAGVTYPGVATGTDLAFTSVKEGVHETLTLKSAQSPHSFRFHLADPAGLLGLAVRQPDGGYRFDKPVADGLFLTMPAARAWQLGDPSAVQYDRQGRLVPSALMTVRSVHGGFDIDESVNPAWLTGKSGPIVLDPSLVYTGSPTQVDCAISGVASAQATSDCASQSATVGADATGARRFLTTFNVSGMPSPAQIVSASVQLTPTAGSGSAVPTQLREPGAAWGTGVTWLQRDSSPTDTWPTGTVGGDPLPTVLGSGSLAPGGAPVTFSSTALTQLVSDWISHSRPNNGLLAMASSETPPGPGLVSVATSEATSVSTRPVLSITYNAPPSQPTSVTATRGDNQLGVSWTTPADNGSPITGYTVKTFTSAGSLVSTSSAAAGATSVTVSGLTNGTAYYATVSATNAIGIGADSLHSNTVIPAGVPFAPTNVTGVRGDQAVTVSWTAANANGDPVTGNTIKAYNGATLVSSTPVGAVTSGTVTGLTNGTSYTFTVTATNTVGTGAASSASPAVTPAGVPFSPTGVSAQPGNGSATISWTAANANGDPVTGNTIKAYNGATLVSSTPVGAVTSGTVTGLTNGTSYTFTVSATNTVGTGTASTASAAITVGVPAIPTSVAALSGDTQATVSWTAPTGNGATISSNTIRAYTGGSLVSSTTVGAVTSGTITGLTNGSSYTFTVTATNTYGSGGESNPSAAVVPAGVPFAPTNVTGTRGDTQVSLTWTAANPNGSPVTGNTIRAYDGATLVSSTPVGAVTAGTVTGLTNGTAYTFTVTATNAVGNGATSAASPAVTPAGVPLAPTALTATAGDQQLALSWTAAGSNGSPLTGYTIKTYTGATLVSTTTAGAAATGATVTGLTNGTGYYAVVTAANSVGTGQAATSNTVTPAGLPFAPTGVTGSRGDSSAVVSWTASNGNGAAITGYTIRAYAGATLVSTTTVGSVTSSTITGLTNGTAYTFTVAAINSVGTGTASTNSAAVTPAGTPFAPSGVSATPADSSANLTWTAANGNGTPITGNTIRAYIGTTLVSTTTVGAVTAATVTGLTNGSSYTFVVTALNSVGTGSDSVPSNAITPAGVPFTPTTASVAPGNASAVLSWTAPGANGSPITGYALKAYTGATLVSTTNVGVTTTGTVTGLTNGTSYTFTVTALNAVGPSAPSSTSAAVIVGVPDSPTGVTATRGDNQATVSWTAPAGNGAAISSYTVTSWTNGTAVSTNTITAPATSGTATGLANGTTYTFTVTASNTYGTGAASTPSNAVVPAGVPFASASITGVSQDQQVLLNWAAASSNGSAVTGYAISAYAGASLVSTTPVGAITSGTVTGLTNGTAYTFTVTASNSVGTGPASAPSSTITPAGAPLAPASVTAVPGDTTAAISWSTPANNGAPLLFIKLTVTPVGGTPQTPIEADATATQTTLTGLTNGQTYTIAVQGVNTPGTGGVTTSASFTPVRATPTEGAGQFVPVTPSTLVDTSVGLGGYNTPIGAGATDTFQIAGATDGAGNVPVPATGVSAVSITVTATSSTANSYFIVYPTGESRPSVTQLLFSTGAYENATMIVKLGTGGQINVFNSAGTVRVGVTVEGYFTDNTATGTAGEFVPLTPARIADTRTGLGTGGVVAKIGAAQTMVFTVTGAAGVPASGVQSVALNLTVVNASTTSSGVVAFRNGDPVPSAVMVSANSTTARNSLVQVAVDNAGKIAIHNGAGTADLLLDVEGYYTTGPGQVFVPVNAGRIYYSSAGLGTGGSTAPLATGETRTISIAGAHDQNNNVPVPATGVTAVMLNVEAYSQTGTGYFTGWPTGEAMPSSSSILNYAPSSFSHDAEGFMAKLGSNGQINIRASVGTVHLIVDVEGYYVTTPATPPPSPSVSSSAIPYNGWAVQGSTGPFTISDVGASNVDHYLYAVDQPTLTGASSATPSSGTTATVSLGAPIAGWHTLYVQAVDSANNLSTISSYPFGIGPGIASPGDGAHTEGFVTLSAGAPRDQAYTSFDWYYSVGIASAISPIYSGYLKNTDGSSVNYPITIPAGTYAIPPTLIWDAASTIGTDGPISVYACFNYTVSGQSRQTCSNAGGQYVTVNVDRTGDANPTAATSFGPGSLNLNTGNLSLNATDVSVPASGGDLSVSRSYYTDAPIRPVPGSAEHLTENQAEIETDTSGFTGVHATLSKSNFEQFSLRNSLLVQPAGSGASNDTYVNVGGDGGALRLGLAPGHSYTLITHIWTDSTPGSLYSTRAQRMAVFYGTTAGVDTEVDSNAATTTWTWQTLRVRFTVPLGAVEAFVRFYNGAPTGDLSGGALPKVYFDGSSLTEEGIFGPGWQSSLPVQSANATWSGLTDLGSQVRVHDGDGTQIAFVKSAAGTWTPIGDDATSGLTLTPGTVANGTAAGWTVTDLDGNSSLFAKANGWGCTAAPSSTCPHAYVLSSVNQPGKSRTTTYSYDPAGRVTSMIAPAPDVPCAGSSTPAGCRVLNFTYSAYGHLTQVNFKSTDGGGAAVDLTVACYTYDDGLGSGNTGELLKEWDPRLITSGGQVNGCANTPVLPTTYAYANTRLSSITPAGLAAYTLGYDTAGRIKTVTRTHNNTWQSTYGYANETSSVEYGGYNYMAPYPGNAASRPSMTATDVAQWAQTDPPKTNVVIFGPGTTDDWTDFRAATVFYMSASGRLVNTANFAGTTATDPNGWQISTTNYDSRGNITSTLDAANRDIALGLAPAPSGLTLPSGTANAALALSTLNTYSSDGMDLTDTLGPYHLAAVPGSSTAVGVRTHSHTGYDTGNELAHPLGGLLHLPVASYTAANSSSANTWQVGSEVDKTSSVMGYALSSTDASGWTFRQPMQVTVDPNGLALSTITRYDPNTASVTESRMPGNAVGGGAGTTLTSYYSSGTTNIAGCVNTAWVNLVCTVRKADASPTSGLPSLTSTQVTAYDYLNRPTTTVETVQDDGTGNARTRTTTTSYENGGLSPRLSQTTISGGLGVAVPASTTSYDTTTGLPVSVSNGTNTITTTYDDFGRTRSYNDGAGNTTTTGYDSSGRVSSVVDSGTNATRSFGYNAGGERRDLPTSLVDSTLGTFTATYDANGALATQHAPNGANLTMTRDNIGQAIHELVQQGATTLLDETVTPNIRGQWIARSDTITQNAVGGSTGGSWSYAYDAGGRLGQVADTPAAGTCTTRAYSYDANSNRLRSDSYASTSSTCSLINDTQTLHTYDAADRLLGTGHESGMVYDAFGRITTLPPADTATGSSAVVLGYFTNDLVRSITQGSNSQTIGLDAAQRLATRTDQSGNQITNHYGDGGDSPSWTAENTSGTARTRNVSDLTGNLAATVDQAGSATWQTSNLHGDVVLTQAGSTSTGYATDEFGNPEAGTNAGRYGWLGGKERAWDTPGGLTLMGVRLYTPQLGRFLQTDPVAGGSANAYDYAAQDPLGNFDLDGRFCLFGHHKHAKGCRGAGVARQGYDAAAFSLDPLGELLMQHGTLTESACYGACISIAQSNIHHHRRIAIGFSWFSTPGWALTRSGGEASSDDGQQLGLCMVVCTTGSRSHRRGGDSNGYGVGNRGVSFGGYWQHSFRMG